MKIRILSLVSISILLSGCLVTNGFDLIKQYTKGADNVTHSVQYDENSQARIRVYYQYANIYMYPTNSCSEIKKYRLKNMLNIYKPKIENIDIGMPKNEKSLFIWSKVDKSTTFKEFVIPANKPITFDAYKNNGSGLIKETSCNVSVNFKPLAGQDYEIWYGEEDKMCSLNIKNLDTKVNQQINPVVTQECIN
ncbi:hypothetical protein [Acinetobacter faecalis]|uniref:hypothetical protein n=1 Tax=Acinetobacter faecalis TaxID=2665161 RepID=UPI002A9158E6|nr:hypothetical protein [Acinetobacter faecalis]MDY6458110.1 hypothetical protein [Acinetobacter faecalis]